MVTILYDRSRPRFPDVNDGHPVIDWGTLLEALGPMRILGFKVGNGWLNDPMSDSAFEAHLGGAESRGLIALGFWFGAHKVDDFLRVFPPKEGRIPCLDFEFPRGHVITAQDAEDAIPFVDRLHDEWGRWPLFYGRRTWVEAGEPTGTDVERCPYWGAEYGPALRVPAGVGTPVLHQFAASSDGPEPHFFPGVANVRLRPEDPLLGPDVNSVLVPFETLQEIAGIGNGMGRLEREPQNGDGDMALDPATDQETFNQMLATALGLGGPGDPVFWQRMLVGIGDAARGHAKRDLPDPYGTAFDWASGLKPPESPQPPPP